MIMNIYVGNLSNDATDVTIREAFESFGEVTSARVIKDKYTGQSRGFGFVEMSVLSQAQTAIKSLNGKELLGKAISVNEARARADQGRRENKWIIAAETVLIPFSQNKVINITAKKAGRLMSKTEPLEESEILSIRRNDE
jgi:RNA recognition motif-containing protein